MTDAFLKLEDWIKEYELHENPASEKQKDILAAAAALFSQLGYEKTPTAEIAKRAGVTERTLFKYFPTKSRLWHRVLSTVVMKAFLPAQISKVKKIMAMPFSSFEDFFRYIYRDRIKHTRDNSAQLKIVLYELLHNEGFRKNFSKIWVENVWKEALKIFAKLQAEGKIRPDVDIKRLARMNTLTITGYIVLSQILAPDLKWDDEAELANMINVLSKGVT